MGAWGAAIFGGDLALEVRGLVRALLPAPLDGDAIGDEVARAFRAPADDPSDDDHADFWFALALSLQRSGVAAPTVVARAVALGPRAVASWVDRGATAADVRARSREIERALLELQEPVPQKARKVVSKPQALRYAPGDVLAWPLGALLPAHIGVRTDEWPSRQARVGALVTHAWHRYDTLATLLLVALRFDDAGAASVVGVGADPIIDDVEIIDDVDPVAPSVPALLLGAVCPTPWPRSGVERVERVEIVAPLPDWITVARAAVRPHHVRSMSDFGCALAWTRPMPGPALSSFTRS